ncbi:MAG TPA: hypothetical protein VJ903_05275 [Clostridia bacterium]|nr:hypothetical protein [Clostridia bacterium]
MKEVICLKTDVKKVALRFLIDLLIIFALLFLIAFVESFIKSFSSSFSYIFKEKLPLFFIMLALSVVLALILAYIEINSRCLSIRYDDEKIIFVKKKKEESMKLTYELYVRLEKKKDILFFSFRQNKRVVNASLDINCGNELIDFLKDKECKLDIIQNNSRK